jgi:uncharacterized membrane protein
MEIFGLGPLELILMLVVFGVSAGLIVAAILVARYLFFRKPNSSTPLNIASQRYARGEITEAQFADIKRNLEIR